MEARYYYNVTLKIFVIFNLEEKETEEELGKEQKGKKKETTKSPLPTRAHTFYCQTHMET